jgi:hypothetical protein
MLVRIIPSIAPLFKSFTHSPPMHPEKHVRDNDASNPLDRPVRQVNEKLRRKKRKKNFNEVRNYGNQVLI